MTPKELEPTIRSLLKQPMADTALREQLEKLAAAEISFSGFTWLFGPELYRRNRLLFRPFILSRFSTYMVLPKFRTEMIKWKGDKARILDAWLTEVDQHDDVELFQRLYDWKLRQRYDWSIRDKRSQEISRELLQRFGRAATSSQRQRQLRKFDLWFELDEATASALYDKDAKVAGPFILRHIPSGIFQATKRTLWTRLLTLAAQRGDEDFRWKLYRRQVPLKQWADETLVLCEQVKDASELVRQLQLRHPDSGNLAEGFYRIVERRGCEVFPYVIRHLRSVWGGWLTRGSYGKMADYAREKGWWDLWAALIRVCSETGEFNKQVRLLVEDTTTPEPDVVARLMALAGASREWNWPGFGLATVHQLNVGLALKFYERFPDLIRGPYRLHVQPNLWGENYAKLLDRFMAVGDEEMIDSLASRVVTRYERWGNAPKLVEEADKLADYYAALKSDEAIFSRRAANVLSKVPAYSIYQYNPLIKQNRLARLLFERSAASYLADPRSLADLVEGAEIHVMALAYRALGLADERARRLAAEHLPLLLGTLLRPMQRDTRTLAFNALANAANTAETARLILERAKDALGLPDTRYPKEQLLALIAKVIHRWPELRGAREQPVVYERAA